MSSQTALRCCKEHPKCALFLHWYSRFPQQLPLCTTAAFCVHSADRKTFWPALHLVQCLSSWPQPFTSWRHYSGAEGSLPSCLLCLWGNCHWAIWRAIEYLLPTIFAKYALGSPDLMIHSISITKLESFPPAFLRLCKWRERRYLLLRHPVQIHRAFKLRLSVEAGRNRKKSQNVADTYLCSIGPLRVQYL